MSDLRHLGEKERDVITAMLAQTDIHIDSSVLGFTQVSDMNDGGMGSIRFVSSEPAKYAATLAEAEYVDSDNVTVLISLNKDTLGNLMELDFWKVDFGRLLSYPSASDLRNIRRGESR